MLMRNSPTISPPVNRKVCLKSFTHSSLARGWWAASQPAKEPWDVRSSSTRLRVGDGGVDLEPVADDAGVGEQAAHVAAP